TQLGVADWDPWLCERFGVPLERLPAVGDSVGDLGVLHHASWPSEVPLRARVVDQQAALAGAGCVVAGRVKATYGTGVFVLAHTGAERIQPRGALLPTVAWGIDPRRVSARRGGVWSASGAPEGLSGE